MLLFCDVKYGRKYNYYALSDEMGKLVGKKKVPSDRYMKAAIVHYQRDMRTKVGYMVTWFEDAEKAKDCFYSMGGFSMYKGLWVRFELKYEKMGTGVCVD